MFIRRVSRGLTGGSPEITVKSDASNDSDRIVGNDTCGQMILSADGGEEHESYLPLVYVGLMPR